MQHLTIVRMVINTSAQPLPRAPLCAVLHKCSFLFCSVLFSIARALFSVMLSFFLSLNARVSQEPGVYQKERERLPTKLLKNKFILSHPDLIITGRPAGL